MNSPEPVLKIQNLRLVFETIQGKLNVLNGVELEIEESEVVGLVGESGCGKSTLALAIIGLLPSPPTRILDGSKIYLKNKDILNLNEKDMEKVRGTGISMVFQEPLTSLNPLFTVGDQLGESVTIALERRKKIGLGSTSARDRTNAEKSGEEPSKGARPSKDEVRRQVIYWLKRVGIPDPEHSYTKYPHELSGGMRQRVMIAMAMEATPALMLADEPTSALDVTTQAQVLKLIRSLKNEFGTSVLFISHDLAVIAQIADRVAVMYVGMVVEEGPVNEMFERALHPYTQALLASFPDQQPRDENLQVIPGSVPSPRNVPSGCPFHPRCSYAKEECSKLMPVFKEISPGHKVACWLY